MQESFKEPVRLVVLTDIDGTLIDLETYEAGPSRLALERCAERNVPVVLVSSKTRAEIEGLCRKFGNRFPFLSENGGGVFFPVDSGHRLEGADKAGDYWSIVSDTSYPELVRALHEAAEATGIEVTGFSDLTVREVARLTGLPESTAALAKQRHFDEPFLIAQETPERIAALAREIERRGFRYTKGGRFHHLSGKFDKGEAVRRIKAEFLKQNPEVRFAAMGDAGNDLPLLREATFPFLIRRPDGSWFQIPDVPGLRRTQGIGPQGFAEAVEFLFSYPGLLTT